MPKNLEYQFYLDFNNTLAQTSEGIEKEYNLRSDPRFLLPEGTIKTPEEEANWRREIRREWRRLTGERLNSDPDFINQLEPSDQALQGLKILTQLGRIILISATPQSNLSAMELWIARNNLDGLIDEIELREPEIEHFQFKVDRYNAPPKKFPDHIVGGIFDDDTRLSSKVKHPLYIIDLYNDYPTTNILGLKPPHGPFGPFRNLEFAALACIDHLSNNSRAPHGSLVSQTI